MDLQTFRLVRKFPYGPHGPPSGTLMHDGGKTRARCVAPFGGKTILKTP